MLGRVSLLLLWLWSAPAHAERFDYHGTFVVDTHTQKVGDNEIHLASTNATFLVRWRMFLLLKEPVVYCDAAWFLPDSAAVYETKSNKHLGVVPPDVLAKIRVIEAHVQADVWPWTDQRTSLTVRCDLGAHGRPTLTRKTTERALKRIAKTWSESDKVKKFSFNSNGSPEWGDLFQRNGQRVTAGEAQTRFLSSKPIKLRACRHYLGTHAGLYKLVFDMSAVHAWLAEQDRKKADELRKGLDDERKDREAKKRRIDNGPADKFWTTPENPRTIAEAVEERKQRDELAERDAVATNRAKLAQHKRAEADRKLANKRRSIGSRKLSPTSPRSAKAQPGNLEQPWRVALEVLNRTDHPPDSGRVGHFWRNQQRVMVFAKQGRCRGRLEVRYRNHVRHDLCTIWSRKYKCGRSFTPWRPTSSLDTVTFDFRTDLRGVRGIGSAGIELEFNGKLAQRKSDSYKMNLKTRNEQRTHRNYAASSIGFDFLSSAVRQRAMTSLTQIMNACKNASAR